MKFLFRADASSQIGSGHVMRCLALAVAVRPLADDIHFVCCDLQGELRGLIEDSGYRCTLLPVDNPAFDQVSDAQQTAELADAVDWLIVDHYGIDHHWQREMRSACNRIMVIDDLADRIHDCDILLDQTFGRHADEYRSLTPVACKVLTGTDYALLRPEFAASRPAALERRKASEGVHHVLVSIGGFDPENVTLDVLEVLAHADYSERLTVTAVCPAQPPADDASLNTLAGSFEKLEIRQYVSNMAELMAASDLAVGAGGTTSWERCCLGLPALIRIMADNQREVARRLEAAGAIRVWQSRTELRECLDEYVGDPSLLQSASGAASRVCDGQGLERVIAVMQSC